MKLKTIKPMAGKRKLALLTAAVSILSIAALACGTAADPTPKPTSTASTTSTSGSGLSVGAPAVSTGGAGSSSAVGMPVSDARGIAPSTYSPSVYYDGQTGQTGIWVTGYGTKDVASDVGVVYLGVESKEDTVAAARQKAAEAMTAVLDAIKGLGVAEDDIVTTSFNIYPQTIWVEVTDSLGRHSEPRITGYQVSNNVEVTVRNLDILDDVIDTAADRGGDLIRVNSVSFTVSNPAQHGAETRQLAAADARAKGQLYAQAMGVNLGPLVFLTEISSSAPLSQKTYAGDAAMAEGGFAPTPIQSGDVSLSTTIQAAYAILP
jgi:uncharacterized protein YggE